MIESNNEKTFIFVSFYTTDEKLCEYEKFFGEKSKNWDKLIQTGTVPGKTGTVGMFTDTRKSKIFITKKYKSAIKVNVSYRKEISTFPLFPRLYKA